jgi:hypothetical protein
MKNLLLWSLVVLNVALAAAFIGRHTASNSAVAQARRPGDFILIPGDVAGSSNSVVYIIDSVNGELSAMLYDDTRKQLDAMPKINLARDFEAAMKNRK